MCIHLLILYSFRLLLFLPISFLTLLIPSLIVCLSFSLITLLTIFTLRFLLIGIGSNVTSVQRCQKIKIYQTLHITLFLSESTCKGP